MVLKGGGGREHPGKTALSWAEPGRWRAASAGALAVDRELIIRKFVLDTGKEKMSEE